MMNMEDMKRIMGMMALQTSRIIFVIFFIFLIGCSTASPQKQNASVSSYNDFNSNIRMFNETFEMKYLIDANKYASTHTEKALLESKLVSFLGANKVFNIQVRDDYGKLISKTDKAFFANSKSVVNRSKLHVSISPAKNLPFTLKYNSYRVEVIIRSHRKYFDTSVYNKTIVEDSTKIILAKNNNWTKKYTVIVDIITNSTSSNLLRGKTTTKLLESPQYSAKAYLKK